MIMAVKAVRLVNQTKKTCAQADRQRARGKTCILIGTEVHMQNDRHTD